MSKTPAHQPRWWDSRLRLWRVTLNIYEPSTALVGLHLNTDIDGFSRLPKLLIGARKTLNERMTDEVTPGNADEFSMHTRAANLARMQNEQFDVAVIGGGITGAGVALDA